MVDVQLFNDSSPHRDVVVGPVEAHVVDVADQPLTLRNAYARCTYQQPPSELTKRLAFYNFPHNKGRERSGVMEMRICSHSQTLIEKKLFRSPIYLAILVYAALKGRYMTARLRITLARPFCC